MSETKWEEELADKDVDEMWVSIRESIERLINEYAPNGLIKNNNDSKWMNRDIKKCVKEKKKAWKKYQDTDKDKYKQWEKKTKVSSKDEVKKAKNRLERDVIKDAKNNPKLLIGEGSVPVTVFGRDSCLSPILEMNLVPSPGQLKTEDSSQLLPFSPFLLRFSNSKSSFRSRI